MNKSMNYSILNEKQLSDINGGVNSAIDDIGGATGAAIGGAGVGSAICGPACGVIGAHYGVAGWAAVTGATGGFNKK